MGDSHHFHHHHHHTRPKSQVFCDDDDDDIDFPERSSSSTGLIRHSETHHSVQSQNQKSELEQLRSRVCQMEKTMRWWSDCTSNWKQKWSQVRQERNALRAQLKEITGGSVAPKPEMKPIAVQTYRCGDVHDPHQQMMMNNNAQSMNTAADVHLLTKLLDEAQRTITIEREEKLHLHRSIERLQQDLVEFHTMYDELVKEVQLLKLDENNKVSEIDQHEDVVVQLAGAEEEEDIAYLQNVAVANLATPFMQLEDIGLVETRVDEDETQDAAGEEEEEDEKRDEIKDAHDDDHDHHQRDTRNCNNERRMLVTMSNSKSQQISSKPIITNDADHHTSL